MHRNSFRICVVVMIAAMLPWSLVSCTSSEGGVTKKGIQVLYSGSMMNYLEPCG